jgi:hypothetical protein
MSRFFCEELEIVLAYFAFRGVKACKEGMVEFFKEITCYGEGWKGNCQVVVFAYTLRFCPHAINQFG